MASNARTMVLGAMALVALAAVSNPALADDAVEKAENTVAEFGWVQAETLRLRALNQLAQEQQLNAKIGKSDQASEIATRDVAPVVARVSGRSTSPTAYILLDGGSIVPATEGTNLPGGYTVVSIDARKVMVRRNGQTLPLGFATSVPNSPHVGASQGMVNR